MRLPQCRVVLYDLGHQDDSCPLWGLRNTATESPWRCDSLPEYCYPSVVQVNNMVVIFQVACESIIVEVVRKRA